MSEIHGRDAGDLKKYRTEIPNIVFTLGLNPYALALYCHLKRTTGAAEGGLCYKSTRTLAEETGMSIGKVSEARTQLEESREELGGKPLIHVERPKEKGKATEVICVDVWAENFQHFGRPCSSGEQRVHEVNTERSSGEHKKEPTKKEPQKNSRKGAQAKPDARYDVMVNPGGYFADLLDVAGKEPTDRERERCFVQLKHLIDKQGATREEMEYVVGSGLQAHMGGYEWWPKDILQRRRQNNVTPLRAVEPLRPRKRVIS